jgi:hypothetical protein
LLLRNNINVQSGNRFWRRMTSTSCLRENDEDDTEQPLFSKSIRTLGFQALHEEGLVNVDEWEMILVNETYGMPRYLTVMYWVEVRLKALLMPS